MRFGELLLLDVQDELRAIARASSAAAALGARGGRSGKGESKRRGDSDYYRGLAQKRKRQT